MPAPQPAATPTDLPLPTFGPIAMLIDGSWRRATHDVPVHDPYRGDEIGRAPESSLDDLEAALSSAMRAKAEVGRTPGFKRAALLHRMAALLQERVEHIALVMSRETGKAIKDSRAEIARSFDTITLSAEEAIRIEGEQVPLDGTAMGAGKLAVMWPFPVGIVAGITPFNAPFNLACHKIAPAIAAGNAVVLKAPPQAALVVNELARLVVDAGIPAGWVNVLYGNTVGPALVRDPRVDFISFTGSSRVGAEIKQACGLRRVALELGGTGPTIVHSDADIAESSGVCAVNSMRLAGQSCLSVQNIHVHESRYDAFVEGLVQGVGKLKVGDPLDDATDVGTLIDEGAATRVESWVREAVAGGARVLTGGTRTGAQIEPTVLVDTTPDMKVVQQEIFGPVVLVHRFTDLDAVLARINDTPYGLHCGIFTQNIKVAFQAIRALKFGGVIVNGSSTWRTDQLPYGGIKNSGIGREGPRYAVREMTDPRFVLFNV